MRKYEFNPPLTDNNFEDFCVLNYDGFSIINSLEFDEDVARVGYVKKLLTRYQKNGELKERLILNHIITLGNVFRPENAVRILFLKIDESQWHLLKPFLEYLHYLPKMIDGLVEPIFPEDIDLEERIMNSLQLL